jgi:hypothetical protein
VEFATIVFAVQDVDPVKSHLMEFATVFFAVTALGWTIFSALMSLIDKCNTAEYMLCDIHKDAKVFSPEQRHILFTHLLVFQAALALVQFLCGVILFAAGRGVMLYFPTVIQPYFSQLLSFVLIGLGLILIVGGVLATWRFRKFLADKSREFKKPLKIAESNSSKAKQEVAEKRTP